MEPGDIIETTEQGLGVCTVDCYEGDVGHYTRALLGLVAHKVGYAVVDYEFGEHPPYTNVEAVRVRFSLVKVEAPESVGAGDNH